MDSAEAVLIAGAARSVKNNESAAIWQLRVMLACGDLQGLIGCKPVRRHAFEFHLGVGRADLVLFHRDCGITIIEAKADLGMGMICAGIGQLFLYESEARQRFVGAHAPKYVNKVLCAPVDPADSVSVWRACELAGVKFVHLARFAALRGMIDRLKGTH